MRAVNILKALTPIRRFSKLYSKSKPLEADFYLKKIIVQGFIKVAKVKNSFVDLMDNNTWDNNPPKI